ncbi:MAG TPA: cytochrome c biogenesis protein DipZ [Solirubrobacterales bacterium]|nr:cytochrome c biogenesis protein DipZ [Solirubrobacterales bacterium]
MALLMLFGFIAGAGTALSPCVLPVLPIALSAGATGGRKRPLGIVVGLALSFTFATVALVYVIAALGLPDDLLRKLAIGVLLAFGIVLMIPPLAARVEATMSRFAGRAGIAGGGGDGFWSGTAVGASLGIVYAPCAGPILAGVIIVSSSQTFTVGRLAVALSYGVGSAVVLYFLMLGGRKLTAPLARRGAALQVTMGAVMVVVALAMAGNYDVKFQNQIASSLPSFLVNPTEGLEDTAAAKSALNDIRGEEAHGVGALATTSAAVAVHESKAKAGALPGKSSGLPVLGTAPEFVGTQKWFNTPGGKPLTLRGLRGRVVLVDFWTYSCINCLRTLPYLTAWDKTYRKDGLTIVGVHSPEFPFEKDAGNVEEAIERNGIHYPVVQDNDLATWSAYANQYWPAEYFIDAKGRVRFTHFGEGEYGEKEQIIRELLAEAGRPVAKHDSGAHGIEASRGVTTPETYLGAARAERFTNPMLSPGTHAFAKPPAPGPNEFAYSGRWRIALESATAAKDASLDLNFGARRVYVVLGSPGGPRRVRVLLDGKPIPAKLAGSDVHGGSVDVTAQRLYEVVDLPAVGHHVLGLEPEPGVMAYSFTFG